MPIRKNKFVIYISNQNKIYKNIKFRLKIIYNKMIIHVRKYMKKAWFIIKIILLIVI